MEPEGKHQNSHIITVQYILSVFGLVGIALKYILTTIDFQGLMELPNFQLHYHTLQANHDNKAPGLDRHSVDSSDFCLVAVFVFARSITVAGRLRARARPPAAVRARSSAPPAAGRSRLRIYYISVNVFVYYSVISEQTMANVARGPAAAGGSQKSKMSLPMGELKTLFIKFLKQQGYEVPDEFINIIDAAVNKISSRDSSSRMSVCSGGKCSSSAIYSDDEPISEKSDNTLKGSDEEAADSFKIVKRKSRKVARRQRKNSSSDESDPTMEVELNHGKKLVHRDSPASPYNSVTKTTIAAPKQTIVGVKSSSATGTKPSPPPP
ncbi:hypothetical protein EVAR_87210_1 [Eumeta japonica]|uniref:Uncharacterized protein n=1 Tax=Eumeta variegata TaxID=151549 RepID=A0A4C1VWQ8_EUMVA|nr:hypothetical protein EVAR_87210_1 [Eumeta japonica]